MTTIRELICFYVCMPGRLALARPFQQQRNLAIFFVSQVAAALRTSEYVSCVAAAAAAVVVVVVVVLRHIITQAQFSCALNRTYK